MVGSIVNYIGDDEAVLIARYLVALDNVPDGTGALRQYVDNTVRNYLALASTCWYLYALLKRVDISLHEEMEARRTLDVLPLWMGDGTGDWQEEPYAEQKELMQREYELIRTLRKCETNLCFHCAGKHCHQARCEVTRKVTNGHCKVTGVADGRVYNMSVCSGDQRAFVAMRTHDASRHYKDVIRLYDKLGNCDLDANEFTLNSMSPNLMAAHPDGLCCAFTCELESVQEAGNEFANVLYLIAPGGLRAGVEAPSVQRISASDAKRYDGVTDMPGVCHAQGVWWVRSNDAYRLAVAWSTTLVSGSGHDMHGGEPVRADERFVIATYQYDQETFKVHLADCCGPYYGRLLTIKATQTGIRAAAHVRRWPQNTWDMHYVAVTIDINSAQARIAKHPSIWNSGTCKGKRRIGKDGFDWGPSAVGISPAGDSLVCMHRTAGKVVMEVLDHTEGVQYTTTNSRDITEYFTYTASEIHPGVDYLLASMWEEPTSSDSDGEEDYLNRVKLPFDVGFTSSGSHACLVDRRPQFGSRAANYSTVLVDITRHRQVKRMKALPLFRERGSAAKALHWGWWDGMWVQGRRGATCVMNECQ